MATTTISPEISIVDTVYLDALDGWQEQIAAEINAGTYALSGEPTGTALSEETQVEPKSITEEQVLDYVLKKHPNLKGVFGTNQVAVKALVDGIERGKREGFSVRNDCRYMQYGRRIYRRRSYHDKWC